MNSLLFTDPNMALTLAHYHQDDIRRAVSRRKLSRRGRRRSWATPTRPVLPAGVTSIPVTAAEVEVPSPRQEASERVAS